MMCKVSTGVASQTTEKAVSEAGSDEFSTPEVFDFSLTARRPFRPTFADLHPSTYATALATVQAMAVSTDAGVVQAAEENERLVREERAKAAEMARRKAIAERDAALAKPIEPEDKEFCDRYFDMLIAQTTCGVSKMKIG